MKSCWWSNAPRRFCLEQAYPHEAGVFLGYPLEDVIGFIENRGWNCTCCGLWKSCGDPAVAEARFQRCRACTAAYKQRYEQGTPDAAGEEVCREPGRGLARW